MRLHEACSPTFARHETFHPKLGWFRKGVLAASRDGGNLFHAPDAAARLGVGKNMVRSIRFWTTAARLITDVPNPENNRVPLVEPTNLGLGLLGPDGADPYMENMATWWWIHWMMLSPGSQLPVWWILLNELSATEFDDELAHYVVESALERSPWEKPSASSIDKDISAFIRTYAPSAEGGRSKFDDQFGCPLRDLHLLRISPTGYRLAAGEPRQLPPEVVVAAALDYVAVTNPTSRTIALSRLANEPGAPGKAFRLGEEELTKMFEPLVQTHDALTLSAPAGSLQLGWKGTADKLAQQMLGEVLPVDPDGDALAGVAAREPGATGGVKQLELLAYEAAL